MKFNICLANHNKIGRNSLTFILNLLEAGLTELGHEVIISEKIVFRSAINIFMENFNLDSVPYFRKLAKNGYTFGIYATEVYDGSAFNWRKDPTWKNRFYAFKKIAPYAQFIWVMYEDSLAFYSKFAPSAYLPLGYSEKLATNKKKDTPQFDFGFWGLPTPYRINLFHKLKKHGSVIWPSQFLSETQLDIFLKQIKIGLDLKQSEHWPAPSPVRIPRLVMAECGIITEKTKILDSNGPGKLQVETIPYFPNDSELVNFMRASLKNWKDDATATFEHYKTKLPMTGLLERALESSLHNCNFNNSGKPISLSYKHQPLLVFHYLGYNIVKKNGHYLALSTKVRVKLSWSLQKLLDHRRKKHLFVAKSIKILMGKIDIYTPAAEHVHNSNEIKLISEYKNYIIAKKTDSYLAIKKENAKALNSINLEPSSNPDLIKAGCIDSLIKLIDLAEIFEPIRELKLLEYTE